MIVLYAGMVLTLFGCANKGPNELSEITSVSYSYSNMDNSRSCSFWLREENGEVLYDGLWYDEITGEKIELVEMTASKGDIKAFEKLSEEHDFPKFLRKNKPKRKLIKVTDEAMYGFCVCWSDGTMLSTNRHGEFYDELKSLFVEIGKRLSEGGL